MEKWEYDAIRIDWLNQEKMWHARLPNGKHGDDKTIRVLLNYWGAEG